ncbi:MAG TPA: hypothetical protein IAA99_07965 [Candidatus Avibacteroides faecavium]|nr:hypothetical protein [Candidatus Avibacteroides faecavium]
MLDGEVLLLPFFKRQFKLIVLIVVLAILYVSNRYSAQQEQIEIKKLKAELIDARYMSLSRSSELMKESRQSNVQKVLEDNKSEVKASTQPPILLEANEGR